MQSVKCDGIVIGSFKRLSASSQLLRPYDSHRESRLLRFQLYGPGGVGKYK